jgi:imidazolonepropionase-like amidohydrolase
VGSLEVGKDADIVIWTAAPLTQIGGEAYIAIIDGKIVHSKA